MSLRDTAAELAGRTEGNEPGPRVEPGPPTETAPAPEPLPDVDIPAPGEDGPEEVPVHVAWSRVMETVRFAAKGDYNKEGGNYWYRGVDQALNLFGPACRLHGVLVVPVKVETAYRDTRTSRDKPTRECTCVVTYRIYGPKGDHIEAQAAGESLDQGDKGSAKAQAVALRTLLYHAGLVPLQDTDPDAVTLERGEAPVRPAASYRDEALDPGTSRDRMRQMLYELRNLRRAGETVVNEHDDEEPIGTLVERIGKERFAPAGGES